MTDAKEQKTPKSILKPAPAIVVFSEEEQKLQEMARKKKEHVSSLLLTAQDKILKSKKNWYEAWKTLQYAYKYAGNSSILEPLQVQYLYVKRSECRLKDLETDLFWATKGSQTLYEIGEYKMSRFMDEWFIYRMSLGSQKEIRAEIADTIGFFKKALVCAQDDVLVDRLNRALDTLECRLLFFNNIPHFNYLVAGCKKVICQKYSDAIDCFQDMVPVVRSLRVNISIDDVLLSKINTLITTAATSIKNSDQADVQEEKKTLTEQRKTVTIETKQTVIYFTKDTESEEEEGANKKAEMKEAASGTAEKACVIDDAEVVADIEGETNMLKKVSFC